MRGLHPCKVGDVRLQVFEYLHHSRACAVVQGRATAEYSGCNGYLVFPKYCPISAVQVFDSRSPIRQVCPVYCILAEW